MRADLASIVDRMNRDRSYETATRAQAALVAVYELQNTNGDWFNDLPWDWQPEAES